MALFVKEILEAKMCLVHLLPCVCRGLLVSASGRIGVTVESLESRNEGCCLDAHSRMVCISVFRIDQLPELVNGRVAVGLALVHKLNGAQERCEYGDGHVS